ncbi:MAG: hypothetical protein C4K58_02095 [Flavobacteriaceae bacterium]|nr:MAG: hypothetical protein C4K58_02095 [Flavobacteriaceae bacterium]
MFHILKNYYHILGLSKTSDKNELLEAFWLKSGSISPKHILDIENLEKYLDLIESFEVLSNKKERDTFDLYLQQEQNKLANFKQKNIDFQYNLWQENATKICKSLTNKSLVDHYRARYNQFVNKKASNAFVQFFLDIFSRN